MTLRQEVEVHEIHAESDYDEDDEGPVAPGSQDGSLSQLLISRNRKEPFENLPRPSSHPSVPQHEIPADDYDENGDGQSREVKQPFGNLPRLHPSVLLMSHQEPHDSESRKGEPWKKKGQGHFFLERVFLVIFRWVRCHASHHHQDSECRKEEPWNPFDGRNQYQDEPDEDIELNQHIPYPVGRGVVICRVRRSLNLVLVTLVLVANRTIVHMSTQATLYGARATNSHDSRRGVWVFNMAAYLDPHGKAITFQALRRCLESVGPRGLSGESGGSEGLASATTDNRPMSIDVYRAPAPGPSAPKPPGQPTIGGGLV